MPDRWPLTGRAEELRVISEALVDGEHHGIVLAGLAGVGKTRLARAAADAAASDGWVVRRIAGTAAGRSVTLGAFAMWADDPSGSPLALTNSVLEKLTADVDDGRLLLFVDDAHLLDDMSALVVHQMALQGTACVMATIRTGDPAPDAVTALWKNGLLRRLELQPLSREESDMLLESSLDGPASEDCKNRMWNLSRGNVLFLRHLVEQERDAGRLSYADGEWRWTGAPLASPSLVEVVELQIGAVPDHVHDVVDIVAVAEPIDRGILAALVDVDAIETAEQLGLITASTTGDAVYVGHPLYAEIRLAKCGPMRLRRLRGQAAKAMAHTSVADPLRLGLLWLDSDQPPDADILSRAAELSAARLDFRNAERLVRAAAAADASVETKLALARILLLHDKGEAAQEILDTIDAQDSAAVAGGFYDETILRTANLLWPLEKPDEARAVIEEAIAAEGDSVRGHSLRTMRSVVLVNAAHPAEAIETMATVDYDLLDDFGRVAGYASETLALGDLGCVAEADEKASAAYRKLDESPQENVFHGTGLEEFHVQALLAAGLVAEACTAADRGYERHAQFAGQSRWMAIATLGIAAIGMGDLPAALRHLGSASKGLGDHDNISALIYRYGIYHTEALARSGDTDAATASLQAIRESHHATAQFAMPNHLCADAWVAAISGRVTEAREKALQAAEFARSHGQLAREVVSLQTAVQFGEVCCAERLGELAVLVEGPRAAIAARYAAALAGGDAAGLDAASHDFEEMGDILAAVDAAAQAANVHRLAGRKGSAMTAGARAHALAKKCGGAVSPALALAQVPLPFTRREHEIAKLVADGLTNKEIAAATSLSVRTVEGHIYQATVKAGLSSRAELAELISRYGTL